MKTLALCDLSRAVFITEKNRRDHSGKLFILGDDGVYKAFSSDARSRNNDIFINLKKRVQSEKWRVE